MSTHEEQARRVSPETSPEDLDDQAWFKLRSQRTGRRRPPSTDSEIAQLTSTAWPQDLRSATCQDARIVWITGIAGIAGMPGEDFLYSFKGARSAPGPGMPPILVSAARPMR